MPESHKPNGEGTQAQKLKKGTAETTSHDVYPDLKCGGGERRLLFFGLQSLKVITPTGGRLLLFARK